MDLFNKAGLRLDNEATPHNSRELCVLGVLSPKRYLKALSLIRNDGKWLLYLRLVLLGGGLLYVSFGGWQLIYAYWPELSFSAKIIVMQALLVIFVIAGWYFDIDSVLGKICVISSIFITGFSINLLFRHYPTVSYSWLRYLSWFMLVLPWLICSKSASVWVIGLLLANYSAFLWSYQIAIPYNILSWQDFLIILSFANLLVLMSMEVLSSILFRKRKLYLWITSQILTLSIALFLAGYAVLNGIYLGREVISFLILCGFLLYFYFRIYPKYYGLMISGIYICVFVLLVCFEAISNLIDEFFVSMPRFLAAAQLLHGIAVLIVFSLLSWFLIAMNSRRDRGLLQ